MIVFTLNSDRRPIPSGGAVPSIVTNTGNPNCRQSV
jgi:hypothetical protein